MEMNSNINRGLDNRTLAMNQLAEFQEVKDEDIYSQNGLPRKTGEEAESGSDDDDDEGSSIASRFEGNDNEEMEEN